MRALYAETCQWLGVELGPAAHRACRYLERAGLKFCVDFGYVNAIDVAKEHRRKLRQRKKKPTRQAPGRRGRTQ